MVGFEDVSLEVSLDVSLGATMVRALQFTSNLKLGHYMKVPYVPQSEVL